jgi:hypothetical protein
VINYNNVIETSKELNEHVFDFCVYSVYLYFTPSPHLDAITKLKSYILLRSKDYVISIKGARLC